MTTERDEKDALRRQQIAESEVQAGQFWRHYKGGQYAIIDIATHTETDELMVVYTSAEVVGGDVWVRPLDHFLSYTTEIAPGETEGTELARFTRMDD